MANIIFSWDDDELKEASSDALLFNPEQLQAMALRYLKALVFQHEAIEIYYLINMVTNENCDFIGVFTAYVEDRQILSHLLTVLDNVSCEFEPPNNEVVDAALDVAASERGKLKHQLNVNLLEDLFEKSEPDIDPDTNGKPF
jgi:hypothetical protein